MFWTKSEAWEYEREWRLRYPRIDAYTRAGLIKPHAVIFGLKCAPEVRKFIKDCSPGLRYGEIDASSHDYHLTIVWEDNATEIDDPEDEPSVELSEMLEKVLAMTIDVARGLLERFGEFAPFGLVIHQNQADFLMIENPAAAEAEGIQGHQLMRRVEELVREARDRQQLDFAGIITDINVWPVDGGPMTSAIQGRIEERGGLAVQFLQHYEIRNDVLSLGEKWIFPKDHLLLP